MSCWKRERRRKTGREGERREERDKGKGEQTLNSTRGIDEGIPAGHEEREKRGEERRDESKENRTERRQVRGERREKVRRRRRAPGDCRLRKRTEKVAKVVSHVNEV
jgi:hypothetical protein